VVFWLGGGWFFVCFFSAGSQIQGVAHARQVLCH
jgi:hypothetical protein